MKRRVLAALVAIVALAGISACGGGGYYHRSCCYPYHPYYHPFYRPPVVHYHYHYHYH